MHELSYLNPIGDLPSVAVELKGHMDGGCFILLDMLLPNGDSYIRFAEAVFDGKDICAESVCIVELAPDDIKMIDSYYRGKIKNLNNSVLSAREQYRYATAIT